MNERINFWNDLGLPLVGPHLTAHDATIVHLCRDKLNHAMNLIEEVEEKLSQLDNPLKIKVEFKIKKESI